MDPQGAGEARYTLDGSLHAQWRALKRKYTACGAAISVIMLGVTLVMREFSPESAGQYALSETALVPVGATLGGYAVPIWIAYGAFFVAAVVPHLWTKWRHFAERGGLSSADKSFVYEVFLFGVLVAAEFAALLAVPGNCDDVAKTCAQRAYLPYGYFSWIDFWFAPRVIGACLPILVDAHLHAVLPRPSHGDYAFVALYAAFQLSTVLLPLNGDLITGQRLSPLGCACGLALLFAAMAIASLALYRTISQIERLLRRYIVPVVETGDDAHPLLHNG